MPWPNFKVYAIDLWGWGYSERLGEKEYSFERYGKQVVGFMDALNIKKATLAGQSMGGGFRFMWLHTIPGGLIGLF